MSKYSLRIAAYGLLQANAATVFVATLSGD